MAKSQGDDEVIGYVVSFSPMKISGNNNRYNFLFVDDPLLALGGSSHN